MFLRLGIILGDVGQVAVIFGAVQTVTDHEMIGNGEQGNIGVVVYNTAGGLVQERNKTKCTITVPKDVKKVYLCNILEDIKYELPIVDSKVALTFKPFQIVSLMMVR